MYEASVYHFKVNCVIAVQLLLYVEVVVACAQTSGQECAHGYTHTHKEPYKIKARLYK